MPHVTVMFRSETRCDGDEKTGARKLMRAGKAGFGPDASTGKYVDLLSAGIVDATKVVRTGLENAVSVASVLLLTEATITEVREKKPAAPSPEMD